MRETTPDPFVLEDIVGKKTIKKQDNKKIKHQSNKTPQTIKQQKNITFSLSLETIHFLEEVWLQLRRTNPKATKTAIVEYALQKTLNDMDSIEL